MRWFAGLLAVLGVLAFSGLLPLARFTAETISIEIDGDRIRVDGTYVYENPLPFPIRQGMAVPLPSGYEPIGIGLWRDGKPLPLRRIMNTHRFELPLRAFETAQVHLQYEQYAPAHYATYLLTTTAPWHRPIDRGAYMIRTHGRRLLRSSYLLSADNMFERRRFMPDMDWTFAWQ